MELFDIPGFESYKITKCGKVYSLNKNKFIYISMSNRGYYSVKVYKNNKPINTSIHRLLAMTFIGESQRDGYVVNHINENKLDNSIENLEWCSSHDNVLHYYKYIKKYNGGVYGKACGLSNGFIPREKSNVIRSLLSRDEYEEVYKLCENKIPIRFISRKFPDISIGHLKSVYNFINGKKKHFKEV